MGIPRRCAATGVAVVALVGAVWLAGNTRWGCAVIEGVVARLTAGHVRLSGLGGRFPAQLTLDRLTLSDDQGIWLTADSVALQWSPGALLSRRIRVERLHAARVAMGRAPVSSGAAGGNASIQHIDVGQFTLDEVDLGAALVGANTVLRATGRLELHSLEDANADLSAQRLGANGDYRLHLRIDPKRLDASLSLHEPAGGPLEHLCGLPGLGALSATMTVAGLRTAEQIDADVAAGTARLQIHGKADWPHRSADLDYVLETPALEPRPGLGWQHLSVKGSWRGPLVAPVAAAHLAVANLRIGDGTRLTDLAADMTAHDGKLDLKGLIEGLEIPGPQRRVLADQPLKVDASLQLDTPLRPITFSASHPLLTLEAQIDSTRVDGGERHAKVRLRLPDMAPVAALVALDLKGVATLDAQMTLGAATGSLGLSGDLDVAGGTSPWARTLGPHTVVTLAANMTDSRFAVSDFRLASDAVRVTASGDATREGKDLHGSGRIDVAELGKLSNDLKGSLSLATRVSGSLNALTLDADATTDVSVRGSSSGRIEATVHARDLPTSPNGVIQAHGMLDGAPLSLDAALERLDAQRLRVSVRQADWKSVHADGDATIDADLTHSQGQLRLKVVQLGDFDRLLGAPLAGSVDGSLGFKPLQGRTQAEFSLYGTDLKVASLAGDVQLHGAGSADAFRLQLEAKAPAMRGAPVSLAAAAVLNIDRRTLQVESIIGHYRNAALITLAPAQLSFTNGLSLDQLKVGVGNASFEIGGRLTPALELHASLQRVGPELLNLFAPQLLTGGTLEARATLAGTLANPTGSLQLDVRGLQFGDAAATGLPALDLHAGAQLADLAATVQATLAAGPGSQVKVTGTAPLDSNGALDLAILGKLDLGLADPLLEARGLRASGVMNIDATVTGNAATPVVGGGITLAKASVRDYVRGVSLSDISAAVTGIDGGLQIKSFEAKSAAGSIGMTGTFGVLQPGMPLDLRITAKNAQPIASSVLTANLNADLHISGKALEQVDAAGKIHVNRATIGIPDSMPPEVASLDVRRRGQQGVATGDNPLVIRLDIDIDAPQEILVQGRGLDAELGGNIKISGTAADPQVSGGFDLQRGSFTISGNQLSLSTPGRVGFDGAGLKKKIDPTLEFAAKTVVGEYQITLQIGGFADAPRFTLLSQPDLPPDQLMSLLLFSQPAAQLSALQVAEVGAALATLTGAGGGGANPLTRLQKTLGLDRLTVGSNTTTSATGSPESTGAAIAAGRYVTKRIYVEGKQTTTGASQVQVDIDLTKHLKLQTRLGNGTATTQGTTPENDPGSAVGLSYQFEY